jgi:hypothetical protein
VTSDRRIVHPPRHGAIVWLIFWCLLNSATAHAKATVATLSELTKESSVIVLGHVAGPKEPAETADRSVSFAVSLVLKGGPHVRGDALVLCNSRPNEEWPDMSTLTGEAILFVYPKGACFNLSHNYRSVVRVQDGQASTGEIRGEPEHQPLEKLLQRLRTLISRESQVAR